jgi:hypothetical protein
MLSLFNILKLGSGYGQSMGTLMSMNLSQMELRVNTGMYSVRSTIVQRVLYLIRTELHCGVTMSE